MQQATNELFARYERETAAALAGKPDLKALRELYDDSFIAASPAGIVSGKKDDAFVSRLAAGFEHYRAIGTRKMVVRDLRVQAIDALHTLAHVAWQATYDSRGVETVIDFTNVYLVRVDDDGARVFGWITGDEEAVLRSHGVID